VSLFAAMLDTNRSLLGGFSLAAMNKSKPNDAAPIESKIAANVAGLACEGNGSHVAFCFKSAENWFKNLNAVT
jgi:hypothetical protein